MSDLGTMSAPLSFQSLVVVVVVHPAMREASTSVVPKWCLLSGLCRVAVAFAAFALSPTVGVGHPPQSLSDVRRADARSAEIGCCAGVTRSFQVSLYKVEPREAVSARNLLAKDNWRAALADEPVERGP